MAAFAPPNHNLYWQFNPAVHRSLPFPLALCPSNFLTPPPPLASLIALRSPSTSLGQAKTINGANFDYSNDYKGASDLVSRCNSNWSTPKRDAHYLSLCWGARWGKNWGTGHVVWPDWLIVGQNWLFICQTPRPQWHLCSVFWAVTGGWGDQGQGGTNVPIHIWMPWHIGKWWLCKVR